MSEIYTLRRVQFIAAAVFVFIAATLLAGILGAFAAGFFYGGLTIFQEDNHPSQEETVEIIGAAWGAFTGLLAAAFWCRVMLGRIKRERVERLPWQGAKIGLASGTISAVLLHVVLMLISERQSTWEPMIGMSFGLPVGYLLGKFGGIICEGIMDKSILERAATERPQTANESPVDRNGMPGSETNNGSYT